MRFGRKAMHVMPGGQFEKFRLQRARAIFIYVDEFQWSTLSPTNTEHLEHQV